MEFLIASATPPLAIGLVTHSTERVVYCQYVSYPANCVAGPAVVLRPHLVAGGAAARER